MSLQEKDKKMTQLNEWVVGALAWWHRGMACGGGKVLMQVVRVTQTQVIACQVDLATGKANPYVGHERFRLDGTGYSPSGKVGIGLSHRLEQIAPHDEQDVLAKCQANKERRILARQLGAYNWNRATLDKLHAVEKVLGL